MIEVKFILNGKPVKCTVPANEVLTDTIRNRFELTGTKKTCGEGDCGTCTVLLNGKAIRSCTFLTAMAEGQSITTIEGIAAEDGTLHQMQRSFIECGAVQCGYCTPGMILTGISLLNENPNPTDEEIRTYFAGNLCRCTGYVKIIEAVKDCAARMNG